MTSFLRRTLAKGRAAASGSRISRFVSEAVRQQGQNTSTTQMARRAPSRWTVGHSSWPYFSFFFLPLPHTPLHGSAAHLDEKLPCGQIFDYIDCNADDTCCFDPEMNFCKDVGEVANCERELKECSTYTVDTCPPVCALDTNTNKCRDSACFEIFSSSFCGSRDDCTYEYNRCYPIGMSVFPFFIALSSLRRAT